MTRDDVTRTITARRIELGLTWQSLADAIDRPVVWTTAALLGQHPIPRPEAEVLLEKLGLSSDLAPILGAVPVRGTDRDVVSQDPTIYRLYEALAVYGPALKELIHEQFGDGIMSAINFSVDIAKKPHPSGDRVVITLDGKFLAYDWVSAD
ncbi:cyanase [Williamsia deligens]|uniref:Cyanate hydratase n=1 Tax=Williamsia deligens TaxID=321325 RepID=A0ABW3GBZ0_9NOCA|nr:cyanase [Williamsia deligens]MCP2195167.1 cyanate lyase [Williamsia deligens]